MFKRFKGEATTLDIHLIGRIIHVVSLNEAGQTLSIADYPTEGFQEASDLFVRLCHSFEYVGFTPED